MYSLLQPYEPENDKEDKQEADSTAYSIIGEQHQPPTLFYADVVSFKDATCVSTFDLGDKIEYSKLKEHHDELATQNTVITSLDHPAGICTCTEHNVIQLQY